MKITTGFFGTRPIVEGKDEKVSKSTSKRSSVTLSEGLLGIQLSEDSALLQTFREAARGEEPLRAELVEQAKADIAKGLLGSEEELEQAITALLQEL